MKFALTSLAAVSLADQVSALTRKLYEGISYRQSELKTYDLMTTSGLIWKMDVQSFLNEDTGKEKLRITHDLTANIMKTDKVMFEIAYEVSSIAT